MSDNVTVYSTPFCAPCESLKRYLSEHGVAFTVRDLMMDEEAAERLDAQRIRSTPALEVDGEFYAGEQLNPDTLKSLFNL